MNILIVEDHQLTCFGMKTALKTANAEYNVIAEADTVKRALELLKSSVPIDLVLLDIVLLDGNGLEIVNYIHPRKPELKILVCSMETDFEMVQKLLNAGINGFISKYASTEVLIEAVQAVSIGHEFLGRDISQIINAVKLSRNVDDKLFTDRELEIISCCAKGSSVKEIAEQLFISARTVETHKKNIFKKMGFNNTAELVSYAYEHGIVKL